MKSKLHIAGLIFVALLNHLFSSNYNDEMPEVKNNNFQIIPQVGLKNELKEKGIDSTSVIINTEAYRLAGDPINSLPPRV